MESPLIIKITHGTVNIATNAGRIQNFDVSAKVGKKRKRQIKRSAHPTPTHHPCVSNENPAYSQKSISVMIFGKQNVLIAENCDCSETILQRHTSRQLTLQPLNVAQVELVRSTKP